MVEALSRSFGTKRDWQDRKVGRWLSSVKRLVWDQETASSNLARPTNTFLSAENS